MISMPTMTQVVPILVAGLLGCGDAGSNGDGAGTAGTGGAAGVGGAGPATGSVGSGGGPDPADVTEPSDCAYQGGGGDNGWSCAAVSIALSEPVALEGLEVAVDTGLGDVFTSFCVGKPPACPWEGPYLRADADPATRFQIVTYDGVVYDPSSLSVSMTSAGQTIASKTFPAVTYACHAITSDDWCWESEGLVLEVTQPVDD
jgi:hypothetical protein